MDKSQLSSLDGDLIREIASHLTAPARSSLSLTCKQLQHLVDSVQGELSFSAFFLCTCSPSGMLKLSQRLPAACQQVTLYHNVALHPARMQAAISALALLQPHTLTILDAVAWNQPWELSVPLLPACAALSRGAHPAGEPDLPLAA
ncbi:hypothetical protein HaLaN_07832, partial [Haematococcus lacustris]